MTSPLQRAAGHFRRGAAAYNRGDNSAAIAAFSAGLADDPSSAPAYLFRALCRLRLSLLPEAIADLTQCLDRDPTNADAIWARARAYADQRRWPDSVRDLGRVLALRPDDVPAHNLRGEIRRLLPDWPGCLADYRRAAQLAPDDARTLNRLAWTLATCPRDDLRNGLEAVQLAEQANQLAGQTDPLIWDTLAAAYAEVGRFPDAIVAAKHAHDAGPEAAVHAAAFAAGKAWRDTIPHTGP